MSFFVRETKSAYVYVCQLLSGRRLEISLSPYSSSARRMSVKR